MGELQKVAILILMYSAIAVSSQVIFDDEPEQPNRQSDRNGNVVVITLEQQPSGFHRPTQQRPNNGFGFQQPNNGFQQNSNNGFNQNPNNGFNQNPNSGFNQNSNNGFNQNPNNGFNQNPSNGFNQNPNNGFNQNPNNNGFQGQGQQGFFPERPGNSNNNFQDQSGFQNQNEVNVASRSPDCRTFENTGGFCTPLNACGRIARLIQSNRSPFVAARILRRSICGFSGVMPSVCCPTGRAGQQQQPSQTRPISNNNNNFGDGDFKNNNNVKNPGFGSGNGNGNNGPGLVIIPPTPATTTTTTTPFPIQMVTEPVKKPVGNNPGGLIIGDGPIALLPPQRGGESENLGYSEEGLPKDCGFSNASHTRIVGGKISEKGAWPWIAALGYKDTAGNVNYLCGGALIAPSYVVTASHCLHGRNDLSSVRLGDHDIFSTGDNVQPLEVQVDKIIMHPKYDPNTFKNDIALLHLKTPVPYSRQIHPICLPSTAQLRNQRFENTSPFVAGWGAIQFNGPSSSVLREVQVPTVPDSVCQEKYSSFKTAVVDDTNICAGLQTGGKDACQGDSGGPLQQPVGTNRYILIGVVSFGFKCAEPGFPGIYTRVTSHLDFIQDTIGQNNK